LLASSMSRAAGDRSELIVGRFASRTIVSESARESSIVCNVNYKTSAELLGQLHHVHLENAPCHAPHQCVRTSTPLPSAAGSVRSRDEELVVPARTTTSRVGCDFSLRRATGTVPSGNGIIWASHVSAVRLEEVVGVGSCVFVVMLRAKNCSLSRVNQPRERVEAIGSRLAAQLH